MLYLSAFPAMSCSSWPSSIVKGRLPRKTWYPEGENAFSVAPGPSESLILRIAFVINLGDGKLNAITFCNKARRGKTAIILAMILLLSS